MDDNEAKQYSDTFQEQRDSFQNGYLTDPVTVLFEAGDRLKDSIKHHSYDNDPKMVADVQWLLNRMDELIDALIVSRANLSGGKTIYASFLDRFLEATTQKNA